VRSGNVLLAVHTEDADEEERATLAFRSGGAASIATVQEKVPS
jgi:hypothetical protein